MNTNKRFFRILRILIMTMAVMFSFAACGYQNSEDSFVMPEDKEVVQPKEMGSSTIEKDNAYGFEYDFDKFMVQITVGTHTGSGIVWDITPEEIVIVSNKHILENGAEVKVTFSSGNQYMATVSYLANENDLGFCEIDREYLYENNLSPVKYSDEIPENSTELIHAGINTRRDKNDDFVICFDGQFNDYRFIPEFYEMMIVSYGFSQPGMSGGGVFTKDGTLIGILAGGETLENDTSVTYTIPVNSILDNIQ